MDEIAEKEQMKKEPPVKAGGLLAEIEPLLRDYFIGEIVLNDSGILYRLPNGQRFLLKAEEVA